MFEDMYPCLAAVNRCASVVPRHDGRVIWLTYEPEGRKPFINKTMEISLNHGVIILKNFLHSYSMGSFPDDHSVIWRNIFFVKSQSGHTEKLFAGPVEKTVMLVGKGITYDTGGADIKAGGIMAGMYFKVEFFFAHFKETCETNRSCNFTSFCTFKACPGTSVEQPMWQDFCESFPF